MWSADLPAALFRGRAWRALGGFDERIAQFGERRQDIARRAARLGWWMWFEGDADLSAPRVACPPRPADPGLDRAERMGRSEAAVVRESLGPAAAAASPSA